MSTIKIISDPYQRQIEYMTKSEAQDNWIEINYENNPNSNLNREEYHSGFFPFIAEKVVGELFDEYRDENDSLSIVFEGTSDEFADLEMVCGSDRYKGKIELSKSDLFLENARDILPDIITVFNKISPLISQSVSDKGLIEKELKKFSDASSDHVPICILGNYSSGKSTFINALIGSEILPSGDLPLTAKIYKISNSRQPDRAFIALESDGEDIRIYFDAQSSKVDAGSFNSEFIDDLKYELKNMEGQDLTSRLNRAISIINDCANENEIDPLSDLIEIEMPFVGTVWNESQRDFVIFDTPGSNSASNEKHFRVLKSALENMSNGLPIYVTELDSLDSTDNERLYTELKSIKELDSRFTMIVVNKADIAALPKDGYTKMQERKILGAAVPKNLYSDGIYYVSSIMGLGAKTDGDFVEEYYAEIYEDNKKKYSDPEYRFYKRLYRYNITGEQLKQKAIEAAEKSPNLILANSGLFSVENGIQVFANKYSSYNKCQQSGMFLEKVIDITNLEIDKSKARREESKSIRKKAMDEDQKKLTDSIDSKHDEIRSAYITAYGIHMQSLVDEVGSDVYSTDQLREKERQFTQQQEEKFGYLEKIGNTQSFINVIGDNFVSNIKNALSAKDLDSLKNIGTGLLNDVNNVVENTEMVRATRTDIDAAVADDLIAMLREDYYEHATNAKETIDNASIKYWLDCASDAKKELLQLVTGSSVLDDKKKNLLSEIILSYKDIDFEKRAEDIFVKEDFEANIRLGNLIIGSSVKLNVDKLCNKYNSEVRASARKIYEDASDSFIQSFELWILNLVHTLIENIIDFNPSLAIQSQLIKEEEEHILELENRQKELNKYMEQIRKMMEWKSV